MTEQHTFREWLNDRRLADVIFVHRSAPDRIAAYAHRVILAGRSPYWFKYFANPPPASTNTTSTPASLSENKSTAPTNTTDTIGHSTTKIPTVVTSLDDDGDARPMDSSEDKSSTETDTLTILINEHIDAFRAVLNHMYTGRLPSIIDGPVWLPDYVNLARLYELPALIYQTRRYVKPVAAPSTTATPSSTTTRRQHHDGFLSLDLADGAHNIATGVHVSVGGAKSLSVSIGNSGIISPNDDSAPSTPTSHHSHRHSVHQFDGPSPASSSHPSSPRASSLDLTPTRTHRIGESKYEGSTNNLSGLAGAGSDDMNPVVILKVDPIVLAARSNYFRIMFSGKWRETQKGSVHLPNLSEAQFRAVLSYCYRGYFSLHDCSAKDAIASSPLVADVDTPLRFGYRLIDIARFFGMPDLVQYCQTLMQSLLTPINCASVWLASTNAMHLAPALARACVEYFRANFLQCCLLTSSADDASALAALAAASAVEAKAASSAPPVAAASMMPPYQTEGQRRRAFAEWLASERNRQSSIQSAAAVVARLPLRSSFLALQPQHLLDALGPGTISVDTHVMLSIVEQWADAYARSGRPLLDRHSLPPGAAAALLNQHSGGSLAPSPTPSEEMAFLRQHRRFSASPRNDDGDDEDLMLLAAYAVNTETPTSSAPATPITSTSSSSSTTATASGGSVSFGPTLPPKMEDRRVTARRVALKAALLPPGTLFNASHRSWLLGRRPSHLPPGIF